MICKPFDNEKIKQAKTREEKVGFENEKQTAYILDFYIKNLKRYAVIHDLQLDYKGRRAQIDHLVVTPTGIYVIESKFSSGIIKINENNWIIEYNGVDKAFRSPILQNARHIEVLEDLLKSEDIFPGKRFPEIKNIVALSETTIVKGIKPKELMLAESIPGYIDKETNSILKNPIKIAKTLINSYSENDDLNEIMKKLLKFDVSSNKKKNTTNDQENKNISDKQTDTTLFFKLKNLRSKIAKEENISMPHHIFDNKTLTDFASIRPKSKDEMMKISGVGPVKFDRYGERFLEIINAK